MDYRPGHSLAGWSVTLAGKTVFVTGATGFLGGALVHRLVGAGARVRALARDPLRAEYIRDLENVDIVAGDITDGARLHEVVPGCAIVFHVAAATSGNLKYQKTINVDGTYNVATAAAAASVERLVHVSSVAVYGFCYRGDITEELPPAPRHDPYNFTKAEAESALRQIGRQHDLPYTIIRPGMIYGPRSGMWTGQCFRLARLRPTPWFGDGAGSAYPIHVDDVVEQMLVQAMHPAAIGEAFNAVNDPAPSWRGFLGAYSRLAGHQDWLALPPVLAHRIAPVIETALRWQGEPKDVPDLARYIQQTTNYKMDKARELLGWEPQVDLEAGIESCIPWLQAQGLLA